MWTWVIQRVRYHMFTDRSQLHTYVHKTHTKVRYREHSLVLFPSGMHCCTGFQDRVKWVRGLGGMLVVLWAFITQMDGAQHICWQNIIRLSSVLCAKPRPSEQGPERNINALNSICWSQSYFLDEQCWHLCVTDDEHKGNVSCWPNNEVRAEKFSWNCWLATRILESRLLGQFEKHNM